MVGVVGSIPSRLPSFLPPIGWHCESHASPPKLPAPSLRPCCCAAGSGAGAQTLAPLGPLEDGGVVRYFIAPPPTDARGRPGDAELAVWALESWQRAAGGALKFVRAASEDEALVRLYWAPAAGGQYGEMRPLEVDGRRGAAVYIRPDTAALGEEIATRARLDALFRDTIVYLTCLHELGHALGLAHTADFDGRHVLLRLRRRHRRVLRPLPPHAARARRHSCLIWVVAPGISSSSRPCTDPAPRQASSR